MLVQNQSFLTSLSIGDFRSVKLIFCLIIISHSFAQVIIGERTGIILRESCAVFQDCTVKSRGTIAVVLDSDVKMNECHICDSESGNGLVVMGRRGLTTAEDCDFDGCNGSSIRVLRNGQIHLKNCSIKGSKTSVGMAVIGTGSKASAVSCEFLENQCNGIAVAEGSSLELEDCVIQVFTLTRVQPNVPKHIPYSCSL